jgi:molecular chaperone DnaJ
MKLYLTLGLRPEATASEIRRAYRRLARKYHPGINPGDEAAALRFRHIAEAYETLVDPERRRRYDNGEHATRLHDEARAFEFEGFDFSAAAEGPAASTFGDLFADVLRAAAHAASEPVHRGADLHGDLRVTLEEAFRGGALSLTVTRRVPCVACGGGGRVETDPVRCRVCQGTGSVRGSRGHMVFTKACGACDGTGMAWQVPCPSCGGQGVGMRTELASVSIPAGVLDGEVVRLPGRGNAGFRGAPAGDLLVRIHVAPHPVFRRDGDDLHIDLPIAIHEAAFGARIDVPAPAGACKVRIPPGTRSGQQFRVRERGMPSRRGGRMGDLVVAVHLVLPSLTDERSRELVRELARLHPEGVRQHVST